MSFEDFETSEEILIDTFFFSLSGPEPPTAPTNTSSYCVFLSCFYAGPTTHLYLPVCKMMLINTNICPTLLHEDVVRIGYCEGEFRLRKDVSLLDPHLKMLVLNGLPFPFSIQCVSSYLLLWNFHSFWMRAEPAP